MPRFGRNIITGRKVTYLIAASDAPQHVRNQADMCCDGTDDGEEIMTAFNALPSTGGLIGLSIGTFYRGSTAITPPSYSGLAGQGMYSTILRNASTANVHCINFEGTAVDNRKQSLILSDLTIRGYASSYSGLYGKFLFGPNEISNVRFFYNGTYGVDFDNNASSFIFRACRFNYNTLAGVRLQASTNPESFYDCVWSTNTEEGITLTGDTNEILISGGNFNSNGKQAIAVSSASKNILIQGVHFEDNATAIATNDLANCHILINHASFYGLTLIDNWFNGENGSPPTPKTFNGVRLQAGDQILAIQCKFRQLDVTQLTGAAYYIDGANTITHYMSKIVDHVPATKAGTGTLNVLSTGVDPGGW